MIDTLEADLRSAMDSGSDHLELPEGIARQAWAAGRRDRALQSAATRRWHPAQCVRRAVAPYSRPQLAFAGGSLVIVSIVIAAFALGGDPSNRSNLTTQAAGSNSGGSGAASVVDVPPHRPASAAHGGATPPRTAVKAPDQNTASTPVVGAPAPAGEGTAGTTGTGSATFSPVQQAPTVGRSGVAATRIVKTGSLSLTVKKGQVGATITALTRTTASLGGYVSQSRTDEVDGSPAGSLTLRIPVNRFEDAVTDATALGHETSLSTNAHDVTGKFVDLNARLATLKRTRQTYLTILSQARTIGQTLSVQQRVNDIQQQIEQRQGELKVLRNQSADGTLTVDVSEVGAAPLGVVRQHHRSGWSKAWHTSTGRFNRGIQAIIGGLGPLLLALILLALLYAVGRLVLRSKRTA